MSEETTNRSVAVREIALLQRRHAIGARKTLRDAVAPVFRQQKSALLVFLGVFAGITITALVTPRKYEAEMKIFVNRDRAEAVVTPDGATTVATVPPISQVDLNSEVELLTSRDLLDKVVLRCGLESAHRSWWARVGGKLFGSDSQAVRLADSERALRHSLTVEPLQKTTVIRVAYGSRDPLVADRVLHEIATLYQEKHAAVHQPTGSFTFFEQQTARYQSQLADAEARQVAFDRQEGTVDAAAEQRLAIEQLSQFRAEERRQQARADAAAARILALRAEEESSPKRQTTEMRQTGNAQLLAGLQNTLLSLELKRADMLVKYDPSYPPVKDVETQIAQAQEAIQAAERSPISEVTTDRVPTQDWLATELAKAEADRAEFTAEAASMRSAVRHYQDTAERLDKLNRTETDLNRAIETAQNNYSLYLQKREEARISDALDEQRIVNVAIAEPPAVPALPNEHLGWVLIGGLFTAGVSGIGAAYAIDALDSSFRTPDELDRYLELKVLAAIPSSASDV